MGSFASFEINSPILSDSQVFFYIYSLNHFILADRLLSVGCIEVKDDQD